MARISLVEPTQASAEVKEIYDGKLKGKPGSIQKTQSCHWSIGVGRRVSGGKESRRCGRGFHADGAKPRGHEINTTRGLGVRLLRAA
jgi:hypothetical protein